jgi:hypothetical protein
MAGDDDHALAASALVSRLRQALLVSGLSQSQKSMNLSHI